MSMADRRAELLADVAAHTAEVLRSLGLDANRAEHCGHALADHLAEHWGGQVISIPVDHAMRLSLRERDIIKDRDAGMPLAEVAQKYHLTESGLRKLLRRVQRRNAVDSQLPLFGNDQAA